MTTFSSTSPVAYLEGGRKMQNARNTSQQQQQYDRSRNSVWVAQQQEGSRFVSDNSEPVRAPGSESISSVGLRVG